jgi:hypothetical protein
MKKTFLLAALLIVNCQLSIINCFAQPTEAQQIQTLRHQLSALKKTSKLEKEQMQKQIDFRDAWAADIDKSLETHNIRLMTNKMLIQGTIEGTLMKIKEDQEETSAGYTRTKKIVYAALAAGAFCFVAFLTLILLLHRKNKKVFLLYGETLRQHKADLESFNNALEKYVADLKTEHNQLRIEFRISDEILHKTTQETRLRITNLETTAKALDKEAQERATSLAHFQQTMEDSIDKVKQYMLGAETILQKEMRSIEERIKTVEINNDKLKITP